MKKRGVSPIVSTVLLILIVIILALIIFFWARSFVGEKIEKFDKPIEDVCKDVNFRASIEGNNLILVNRGNVPIYEINVKQMSAGTSKIDGYIIDLEKGGSKNKTISIDYSTTTGIEVVPVLLGESGSKRSKFACEGYGIEIGI